MKMQRFKYNIFLLGIGIACLLQGCIKNDIGYPQIALSITAMQVDGQKGNAVISEANRTVTLNFEESANLQKVQVKSLTVTEGAKSTLKVDDVLDLTNPYIVTLSLYQDYQWTILANRDISRSYKVQNQVGVAEINADLNMAIAYVTKGTKWKDIQLTELKLGPEGSTYNNSIELPSLNWTAYSNYASAKVSVKYEEFFSEEWELRVYRKERNVDTKQADGWVNVAWLYGEGIEGYDNGFELRKKIPGAEWQKVDPAYVTNNGAAFQACVPHLEPETEYECRAYSGDDYGLEMSFTTGRKAELPNGSFDEWSQMVKANGKVVYQPWADGAASTFWDTGNKGATVISNSNATPVSDTWDGGTGYAAQLKSVNIAIKFAAGNLFVGEYLKTAGMDGELSFGKPFTERPTRLRGHIKYLSETINRADDKGDFNYLKGRPDSCHIYIALGDWDEPVLIKTATRELFDKNDPNIIAYAEFISGKTISQYTELNLPLEYRSTSRVPKYLVLVCTASKYGDYFTGGDGSTLWVDDFSLEYDYDD